jgi:signal transduction histidine kinase
LNLLDNAVKFTRDSGGTITIILEKKEDEFNNNPQHVIINIKDTGKGIDPDYLQNLLQNQTLVRGLGCSYVKAL